MKDSTIPKIEASKVSKLTTKQKKLLAGVGISVLTVFFILGIVFVLNSKKSPVNNVINDSRDDNYFAETSSGTMLYLESIFQLKNFSDLESLMSSDVTLRSWGHDSSVKGPKDVAISLEYIDIEFGPIVFDFSEEKIIEIYGAVYKIVENGLKLEDYLISANIEKRTYLLFKLNADEFIDEVVFIQESNKDTTSSGSNSNYDYTYCTSSGCKVDDLGDRKYVDIIIDNGGYGVRASSGADYFMSVEKSFPVYVFFEQLNVSTCSLWIESVLDDDNFTASTTYLSQYVQNDFFFADGVHTIKTECIVEGKTYKNQLIVRTSYKVPKWCKDFVFTGTGTTLTSLAEVKSNIQGKWEGCVSSIWRADARTQVEFLPNGEFKSSSFETMDGFFHNSMYWWMDDAPQIYSLDSFDPITRKAKGIINNTSNTGYWLGITNVVIGENGDTLFFEGKLRNKYGPLTFRLKRIR